MSIDRRYRLLKSNIEVSDLVSTTGATIPPALLGTGTADSSKFLRGDSAWSNTLTAPLSAISALTLNGAAGAYTLNVVGNASSSNSYGLLVQAGTNSADLPVQITNKSGSAQFLLLFGDGHGTLGPSATSGMQWTAGGNFNIAPPASGTALTVGTSTSGIQNATIGLTNFGVGVTFLANQAEIFSTSTTSLNIGAAGAAPLNFYTSAANRLAISAAGNVTVAAPASGSHIINTAAAGLGINCTPLGTVMLRIEDNAAHDAGVEFLRNSATVFNTQYYNRVGNVYVTNNQNAVSHTWQCSGGSASLTLNTSGDLVDGSSHPFLRMTSSTTGAGGRVSSQAGGTASGGSDGDIILIY